MIRVLFLIIICFLESEQYALAYIDPASGSMVMQIIVTAVGALGYTLSIFWSKIKKICKKNDKK